MRLYFVRHGESTGNINQVHQSADEALTDIGIDQANIVAHRFTKIAIDMIISSNLNRAKQTADIIAARINKPVLYSPLFQEFKKPTALIGKYWQDAQSIPYYDQLEQHKSEADWHYADEENYFDLFHRTKQSLKFLESRQESNLLVVSHGMFLKMFHTMMMFPNQLNIPLFERYFQFMKLKNAGITMYQKNNSTGWQLLTLNDFAHLG